MHTLIGLALGILFAVVVFGMLGNSVDAWRNGRKGLGWLTLIALGLFVLMTLGKI